MQPLVAEICCKSNYKGIDLYKNDGIILSDGGDNMLDKRISELRKSKNISQEELADILNTSRQAISKWERGESTPDIDRLKDLASFFNVSIDYLLGYDMQASSLNGFLDALEKSNKDNSFIISVDEIKAIVAKYPNNIDLLICAIDYLSSFWLNEHNNELIDLLTDYCKRALTIFKEDNKYNVTLNDIRKSLFNLYILKEDYKAAKEYLKNNKIYDNEMDEASLELELGNNDRVMELVSNSYLKSVTLILNGTLIRSRLLLRTNKINEAYESINWGISFIKSIGTNEEAFSDIILVFNLLKVVCERYLKLDYKETLIFLKQNMKNQFGKTEIGEDLKFYDDQEAKMYFVFASLEESLNKELEQLKGTVIYDDMDYLIKEMFGEHNE